jgi:hypothetical protein
MLFGLSEILAFWLAWKYDLTDTEAYYWSWSQHPDLGYFDHPPLLAWIHLVFTTLLGSSSLVVRLPALLGRIATIFIFAKLCLKRLKPEDTELAILLSLTAPVFCLGSVIAIPDVIAVPLGLLSIYLLGEDKVRWAALALGLGFLAKWSLIGLLPFFAFFTFKKGLRSFLEFFFIVLAVQVPVLYWNGTHQWATFMFQFFLRHDKEVHELSYYLKTLRSFVGSQFFSFGLLLLGGCIYALPRANKEYRTRFYWISLASIVMATLSSIQGQTRHYWACLILFPMAGLVASVFAQKSELQKNILRYVSIAAITFNWVLMWVGVSFPLGPWFDNVTHQPPQLRHSLAGDVSGWKDWTKELDREHIPWRTTATLASNFRLSSQVAWAFGENYLANVGTVGKAWDQHEYMFWNSPTARFDRALLVADDRYDDLHELEATCETPVKWQEFDEVLMSQTVKVIKWSVCDHLKKTTANNN